MSPSTIISTGLLLLASRVAAQTTAAADPVNSFLSAAFSVYTEVTSILASDASNTASSTSSTSSSATTSSSSSTFATSTSSIPTRTQSPTSATAAAASTSATSHSSGGISGTTLAIILGCVLGALALGLLVLVLVICCRRRRRSRNSSPRLLSPDGEEIESWRNHKNRPQSRDGLITGTNHNNYRNENAGMPNMAQHPAFAGDSNHRNPFVPVPPAPRRTAPNSRTGLTDGTVPGQEPFIRKSDGLHKDNHHGGELAAGLGGAALGAAALHHHEKNKHHSGNEYGNAYDNKSGYGRRSLSGTTYPTTTTNDEAYALNKVPSRKSGEATRPYNGDDYGYGTGPYEAGARGLRQSNTSAPLSPFNGAGHHRGPSGDNNNGHPFLAAGAGALGGAALVNHHHNHQRDRSNSASAPRRSYDSAKTPGPNALLDHTRNHHQPMPNHQETRDLVSPISSDSYSSAMGLNSNNNSHRNTLSGSTAATNTHHIPSEMPGDFPVPGSTPTPPTTTSSTSPHRYSNSLGGTAPAAAALAHRPQSQQQNNVPVPIPTRSPNRLSTSPSSSASDPTALHHNDPSPEHPSSEDSTWRLSSGMPGGWGRNSYPNRNRRDSSPLANDLHLRNAGINPVGRSSNRAGSPGGGVGMVGQQGTGTGTGRRLRLADLKREEEERASMRESRGSWEGGEGVGVGQAM